MKKFVFRLQRVLDYRHSEKKERERELQLKNAELFSAEARLGQILAAQDNMLPPAEEIMTMAELSLDGNYRQALQTSLVNQRVLVKEAEMAVDKAREAYVEKAIETKTLDTLKAKKKDDWNVERRRDERRMLDKLTTIRASIERSKKL